MAHPGSGKQTPGRQIRILRVSQFESTVGVCTDGLEHDGGTAIASSVTILSENDTLIVLRATADHGAGRGAPGNFLYGFGLRGQFDMTPQRL